MAGWESFPLDCVTARRRAGCAAYAQAARAVLGAVRRRAYNARHERKFRDGIRNDPGNEVSPPRRPRMRAGASAARCPHGGGSPGNGSLGQGFLNMAVVPFAPSPKVAAPAPGRTTRVAAALSGGVDSSATACLLRRAGFRVECVFMRNWRDGQGRGCGDADLDAQDAYSVCASLELPIRTADFSDAYRECVLHPFLEEYRNGRTPNPDVLCNEEIKFRRLLQYALEQMGAERLATGHYARIRRHGNEYLLLRARDRAKDQSYFLHRLGQEELARLLFPLGDWRKPQVRRLAAEAGLVTCDKKDSTGICFVGARDFRAFLGRYLPHRPGEIRSLEGHVLGRHDGVWFYTAGQRRGLGIGGRAGGKGTPWYVVARDTGRNIVYVAQGREHPLLYSRRLRAGRVHWVAGAAPPLPCDCQAQLRYRQRAQDCRIAATAGGARDACEVVFEAPQWAAAPGQSVVFYRDEICLGGGIIEDSD